MAFAYMHLIELRITNKFTEGIINPIETDFGTSHRFTLDVYVNVRYRYRQYAELIVLPTYSALESHQNVKN